MEGVFSLSWVVEEEVWGVRRQTELVEGGRDTTVSGGLAETNKTWEGEGGGVRIIHAF